MSKPPFQPSGPASTAGGGGPQAGFAAGGGANQPVPQQQPVIPPQFQTSVLVFLQGLASPIVLYAEQPLQLYDELKSIIKAAQPGAPKLIEKPGIGPLRKVAFLDVQLAGVAIQGEPNLKI
jgi:hypothetical protein